MAPELDQNAVWLVTGCSSGLGQSIARYVYHAGHNIVATARSLEALSYLPDDARSLKLELDVTSPASVTAAIDAAVKRFGRLDVVVNNAGYNVVTEFEGFPDAEARKQMETMFWGPVHITRESLRVFRDVNPAGQGGVVVQVSSIGGFLAAQGSAFYHASKHALEGLTKSIARDLDPKWNIRLMILSPGGVRTAFADSISYLPRHPAYAHNPDAPLNDFITLMKDPAYREEWADPERCAAVLFDAITGQKDRPLPARLNLGADSLRWIRNEVDSVSQEIDAWEEETLKATP